MATRVVMPSFGMYTVEGIVSAWRVAAGAAVRTGETIVEIETEKASYEIESPADGVVHPVAAQGAKVGVEELIAFVLAPGESAEEALEAFRRDAMRAEDAPAPATPQAPTPPTLPAPPAPRLPGAGEERVRTSPLARRLAVELGVDLANVVGTGPGGRIVEADVRAAAARDL